MAVDLERRHDLTVVLDMSFPAVPCAALSIDVLDISGTAENDATVSTAKGMNIHKMRLDQHGRKIGKREYLTPQSQHLVESGSNSLVRGAAEEGRTKERTGTEEASTTALPPRGWALHLAL